MKKKSLFEEISEEEKRRIFREAHPGLDYLLECELKLIRLAEVPDDWRLKAEIFNIDPERVWKTLHYQYDRNRRAYTFCLPMTEKLDLAKACDVLQIPRKMRNKLTRAEHLPEPQYPGTCSPFLYKGDRNLRFILMHEVHYADPIEWGFPGHPELSIIASYDEVSKTLKRTFFNSFAEGDIVKPRERL